MDIEIKSKSGEAVWKWVDIQLSSLKGICDTSFASLILPNQRMAREYRAVALDVRGRYVEVLVRPVNTVVLRIPE